LSSGSKQQQQQKKLLRSGLKIPFFSVALFISIHALLNFTFIARSRIYGSKLFLIKSRKHNPCFLDGLVCCDNIYACLTREQEAATGARTHKKCETKIFSQNAG
jgi:hypothetical protein